MCSLVLIFATLLWIESPCDFDLFFKSLCWSLFTLRMRFRCHLKQFLKYLLVLSSASFWIVLMCLWACWRCLIIWDFSWFLWGDLFLLLPLVSLISICKYFLKSSYEKSKKNINLPLFCKFGQKSFSSLNFLWSLMSRNDFTSLWSSSLCFVFVKFIILAFRLYNLVGEYFFFALIGFTISRIWLVFSLSKSALCWGLSFGLAFGDPPWLIFRFNGSTNLTLWKI